MAIDTIIGKYHGLPCPAISQKRLHNESNLKTLGFFVNPMPTPISPPCGFHPKVSVLAIKLEEYLTRHPTIKRLSHYVASDKPGQEQRHDHNPAGWWTMQVVNGDTKSGFDYISNEFADVQFRFVSNNVSPIKAIAFLEQLDEALLTMGCECLACDGQYVTAIRRSSITLPVVFRPQIQRSSAVVMYEFALKRG